MADFQLELPFNSFFKETKLIQSGGNIFFGLWGQPTIRLDGDEKNVRIEERDRGRLDLIAFEEYGERELWPAIGIVNQLDFIIRDVYPGRLLVLPKLERIYEALQEVDNSGQR